jgi:hypothetical protein
MAAKSTEGATFAAIVTDEKIRHRVSAKSHLTAKKEALPIA